MPHNLSYLARNFLFGLGFFAVLYFGIYQIMAKGKHPEGAYTFLILIGVNTVCYPFAKAVYDKLAGYFLGDSIYIASIFIIIFIRFWVFWFSFLLAPFYLLFFIPNAVKFLNNR